MVSLADSVCDVEAGTGAGRRRDWRESPGKRAFCGGSQTNLPGRAHALLASDVMLGTSAGSAVAAQLGSGLRLDELFSARSRASSKEIDPGVAIDDDHRAVPGRALPTPMPRRRRSCSASARSHVHRHRLRVGSARRDRATAAVARVARPRSAHHRHRHRHRRAGGVRPRIGCRAGRRRRRQLRGARRVAAGDHRRAALYGRRRRQHHQHDAGRRLRRGGGAGAGGRADAPSPFGPGPAVEVAAFPGAPLGVFADDESLAAFGPNPLDPACRIPSAGRAGNRAAASLPRSPSS